MIKAVLFDLDGTLLLSDSEKFTGVYFGELVKYMSHLHGPEELINAVSAGTKAMVRNDGSVTNEEAFWKTYCSIFGSHAREEEAAFADFYATRYPELKVLCGKHPEVDAFTKALKAAGYKLVVATNPLFPLSVQKERISWTGMDPAIADRITAYENSHYSKPDPRYYLEITQNIGIYPEECLMVGNDVREDMEAASATGMQVFLMPEFMINRDGKDISGCPQGNFADLRQFIRKNGSYPL